MAGFIEDVWTKFKNWFTRLRTWLKIVIVIIILIIVVIYYLQNIKNFASNAFEAKEIISGVKSNGDIEEIEENSFRYVFFYVNSDTIKNGLLVVNEISLKSNADGVFFVNKKLLSQSGRLARLKVNEEFCFERELPIGDKNVYEINTNCK